MAGRRVYVYELDDGTGPQQVVSLVEPAVTSAHGLCAEAVLGVLVPGFEPAITPEAFHQSPVFIEYLSGLLAERVYDVTDLIREAARQDEGYVFLLDGRTPRPSESVPAVDVIGAVAVRDGVLVPDSYQHNPNHRLFTNDGFFILPPALESILDSDVRSRSLRSPAAPGPSTGR